MWHTHTHNHMTSLHSFLHMWKISTDMICRGAKVHIKSIINRHTWERSINITKVQSMLAFPSTQPRARVICISHMQYIFKTFKFRSQITTKAWTERLKLLIFIKMNLIIDATSVGRKEFWQAGVNNCLPFHCKYCCTSFGVLLIGYLEPDMCVWHCPDPCLSKQRGTLSGIPVAGKMDRHWWTLAQSHDIPTKRNVAER